MKGNNPFIFLNLNWPLERGNEMSEMKELELRKH
jgi:hypothetical protein